MDRTTALNILAKKILDGLNPEDRQDQLNILILSILSDSPEWEKLPEDLKKEFEGGELLHDPADPRYDPILLLSCLEEVNIASNAWLAEELGEAEVTGKEPQVEPCPCCGVRSLIERGMYEICSVCWWEDDGQDNSDADIVTGGPNGEVSLTQARINFLNHGIYEPLRTDLLELREAPHKYVPGREFVLVDDNTVMEIDTDWVGKVN